MAFTYCYKSDKIMAKYRITYLRQDGNYDVLDCNEESLEDALQTAIDNDFSKGELIKVEKLE